MHKIKLEKPDHVIRLKKEKPVKKEKRGRKKKKRVFYPIKNYFKDPQIDNEKVITLNNIGRTKYKINYFYKDIGKRNRYLVVKDVFRKSRKVKFLCKCDCGRERVIDKEQFYCTHSCGCEKRFIKIYNNKELTDDLLNHYINIIKHLVKVPKDLSVYSVEYDNSGYRNIDKDLDKHILITFKCFCGRLTTVKYYWYKHHPKGLVICKCCKGMKGYNTFSRESFPLRYQIKFISNQSTVNKFSRKFIKKYKLDKLDDNFLKNLKLFQPFAKAFPTIYERWFHLIKCCYCSTYRFYKFFGAKGIKLNKDFLDSTKFCKYCLMNNLTCAYNTYKAYLQRIDKTKNYSLSNCYIVQEKDLHECKTVNFVVSELKRKKMYEEGHHPSVTYYIFYTRYMVYDLDKDDSLMMEYIPKKFRATIGFSAVKFWESVHDEKSCTLVTYVTRSKEASKTKGFEFKPYIALDKNYSVTKEALSQGLVPYKRRWDLKNKEEKDIF